MDYIDKNIDNIVNYYFRDCTIEKLKFLYSKSNSDYSLFVRDFVYVENSAIWEMPAIIFEFSVKLLNNELQILDSYRSNMVGTENWRKDYYFDKRIKLFLTYKLPLYNSDFYWEMGHNPTKFISILDELKMKFRNFVNKKIIYLLDRSSR